MTSRKPGFQSPAFPQKMTAPYYALIARSGQLLGERAQHVLPGPGQAGPQRGLVEHGDTGTGNQRADQLDHVRGEFRGRAQAGMDEPGRHLRPGGIADQLSAPLHRDMLEHHQVEGQGPQVRADRHRRVRHPRRAGRHVVPPAAAHRLVQVVLDPLRGRLGNLQLLERPGHARILRAGQVRAAPAPALREMIPRVVRLGPAHRRPRRARLLAPVPLPRLPLRGPPLFAGRLAARDVITRGRHRGVLAFSRARQCPLQPGHPLPQLRDLFRLRPQLLPQPGDLLIPSGATRAIRDSRRHAGHKP